jgi:hypothetical protein
MPVADVHPHRHDTTAMWKAAAAALAGFVFLTPALRAERSADAVVTAAWSAGGVMVDGSLEDWPPRTHTGDGPDLAVQNDDRSLYLAIATDNDRLRRQLATGLVVWLDASARRSQTFGVRLQGLAPRPLTGADPAAAADDVSGRDRVRNPLPAFDLLGPARNQRRLIDHAADAGVMLASGVERGTIAYELKIPLTRTGATPHAVGAAPGATIGVGLETPSDPRAVRGNTLDDPMNTNPWIFDPYGGYFTPPPEPGGGSGPSKPAEIKPMKLVWSTVRLATPR